MKAIFNIIIFISSSYVSNGQTWAWAKSSIGSGTDNAYSVATDTSGNVYITGNYGSPTITFGSFTLTNQGGIYLVKYNASGNVLWAKSSINSTSTNYGWSVKTDKFGNAFVTGYFSSPTIIFGSYTLTNTGGLDAFLTKYDPNGNVLWAKSALGTNNDYASSVVTDTLGNSYITGCFSSSTIAFGSYTLTKIGGQNAFLAKYDSNGNVLWAKSSTGSSFDGGRSVGTDAIGNSYVGGYFNSPSIVFSPFTLNSTGGTNIFLTKYDINGNVLWAKRAGGPNIDWIYSLKTDEVGNTYVTGYFQSPTITFGSYTLINTGNYNVFLVKYDTNGNVAWAKCSNGSGSYYSYSVTSDTNNIYISGGFNNNITFGSYTLSVPVGSPDPMFIAKYDLNGNVSYATALTSGGALYNGISVDKFCNIYATGDFQPNSFIIGTNTLTNTGMRNVFLAKLSFSCQPLPNNITDILNSSSPILFFPNPNNGSFKFQIDNEIKNGELSLINSIGQIVHKQKIIHGINDIKTNGLPIGLYNYILLQDNKTIINGKITIQ